MTADSPRIVHRCCLRSFLCITTCTVHTCRSCVVSWPSAAGQCLTSRTVGSTQTADPHLLSTPNPHAQTRACCRHPTRWQPGRPAEPPSPRPWRQRKRDWLSLIEHFRRRASHGKHHPCFSSRSWVEWHKATRDASYSESVRTGNKGGRARGVGRQAIYVHVRRGSCITLSGLIHGRQAASLPPTPPPSRAHPPPLQAN